MPFSSEPNRGQQITLVERKALWKLSCAVPGENWYQAGTWTRKRGWLFCYLLLEAFLSLHCHPPHPLSPSTPVYVPCSLLSCRWHTPSPSLWQQRFTAGSFLFSSHLSAPGNPTTWDAQVCLWDQTTLPPKLQSSLQETGVKAGCRGRELEAT